MSYVSGEALILLRLAEQLRQPLAILLPLRSRILACHSLPQYGHFHQAYLLDTAKTYEKRPQRGLNFSMVRLTRLELAQP